MVCDFCGEGRDAVELLIRSKIGSIPAKICAGCVDDIAATLAAARAAVASQGAAPPVQAAVAAAGDPANPVEVKTALR